MVLLFLGLLLIAVIWLGSYLAIQAWVNGKLRMWSDITQLFVAFLIGALNLFGVLIAINLFDCGSIRC